MRKIGKLDDGTWICQLTEEEVARISRREGFRKNRAQYTASLKSILQDIECVYGLPEGSLCVKKPDGSKRYRSDTKIGTIRREGGI